jgi:hypothetical protein
MKVLQAPDAVESLRSFDPTSRPPTRNLEPFVSELQIPLETQLSPLAMMTPWRRERKLCQRGTYLAVFATDPPCVLCR